MIISLFKTNQISGIVFLFLFQALLFLNAFLHPIPLIDPARETQIFETVFGPVTLLKWVQLPLAFVLIFLQALLYNYLIIQLNILGRTTYLPAFFYVVASCMLPVNIYLNSGMVAMSFSLLALFTFFRLVSPKFPLRQVFYTSFLFSLGSLFYFPLVYFLPFVWVALLTLGYMGLRQWMVSIIGFVVPYIYVFLYYFWFDGLPEFWEKDVKPFFGFPDLLAAGFTIAELALFGLLVFIMASSAYTFIRTRFTYKVIQRKIYRIFSWFFLFVFLSVAYMPFFNRHHLVLLAFPAGVFLSLYFLNLRRQWWADVITVLLFSAMVVLQFGFY